MNKKQWTGLLMVYVSYLFLGATIFYFLEHDNEYLERSRKYTDYQEIQNWLDRHYEEDNIRDKLEDYCGKTFSPNKTFDEVIPVVWDFYNSFFFVITVVSTIGYGNFHPSSDIGRVIMIFYAIFGIPLNGILLTSLGQFFGAVFLKAHTRYKNQERYDTKCSLAVDIMTYLTPGIIVFIFLPAGVITYFENWTYIESVYYAFVTLSTIGFGDLVAGQQDYSPHFSKEAVYIYKGLIFCWVIFGLGYLIMLLGFVAQGMNSKKLIKLEQKLLTSLTHSKIWNGFSKDIGYLRRLMNEIYLDKLKPVFRDDEVYTPPIIHRSKSLPDLPSMLDEEYLTQRRRGKRAMSEHIPSFTRVFSESDLQRIDKNRTFAAAAAVPTTTFELMRKVIDVYSGGQLRDWSSSDEDSDNEGLRGVECFSDDEVLASERDFDQQRTVTSRHPSSIFYMPSYEDTVSRRPHRGRAMSECPPPELKNLQPPNASNGAADWTWSGPAANKLHDVIKQRTKQKLFVQMNKERNSLSSSVISGADRLNILKNRRRCVSDNYNDEVSSNPTGEINARPSMDRLNMPKNLNRKRQSLQERRISQDIKPDGHYMTVNPGFGDTSHGNILQMYSQGDTFFNNSNRRELLEETSIADFLRVLTNLHSKVGEHLVAAENPKPRRKLGTASLTPPKIRSLLDLFEPPTPRPTKKRKQSVIPNIFRSENRKDSVSNAGEDKPEKAEPSNLKRFGRFLLRSYSIVPKDLEDQNVKPPGKRKRFSLWPTDGDSKDPPFQLQVDSPSSSRRQSVDVVIPIDDEVQTASRRSSIVQRPRLQVPSPLATSTDSVFLRTPPVQRRMSHPRWHMDSSLSDVKEA